ncbi:hypothetical protein BST25_16110 [Mycobacterium heidelbergense]|uniref:DUF2029 domain-containing protein n=1 Tax=Mycobacterium heidelbergense TaxID=53376 RepID=A0A1X0DH32_MYCHE|nr:hypothetical protein BST25_16110 [Mycobacterium heidelbergense]
MLLRSVQRLWNAALFAEDGKIFLAEAHNNGLGAFVKPYAGYLHLIPRMLAALLEPFPATAAPVLYAVAALVVHVAMLVPALSVRLDWIIPGRTLRAVLFTLLCLMPPLPEALANVANLIFVGGISLLLLMLSDDPRSGRGRVGELLAVGALGLSGPLIVLFAPWFVWRWRRTRSRHSLVVLATVVSAALVQGAIFLLSDRPAPGAAPGYLPRVWVERIGVSWLFGHVDLLNSPIWIVLSVAAMIWCVGVVVVTVVALRRTAVALWLLHFALLAAPVLAYGYMPPPSYGQRHFVVPTAIVIVMLVAVIGARRWAVAAIVLLAVGAGGMLYDFIAAPYPYRPGLAGLQQCVARGERVCRQTIYDNSGGWWVELRQ